MGDFLEHYFTNNDNLKSEFKYLKYNYKEQAFEFISDNGVFSKSKIDYGSKGLVELLIKNTTQTNMNILDVGCGYGFIGITLSKVLSSHVDMVDVNKRAVHLTELNIKNNKVDAKAFLSNGYETVTNKYDLIVTNPPIRAGKEVVYSILLKAIDYLNDDGVLWFVIRKDQGAKSAAKDISSIYDVTLMGKDKGYYYYMAKKAARA